MCQKPVNHIITAVLCLAGMLAAPAPTTADQATALSALARMPIKEVTIFKDGHAFVLHEGKMPTDAAGNVVMDYLPTPVLGTFWAHSAEKRARLSAVLASQHKVRIQRTALSVRELIEGNIGAQAMITEVLTGREAQSIAYPATIVAVPERSGEELDKTDPPNSGGKLPQKGSMVLLKTEAGTKAAAIDRILDVTFVTAPKRESASEEFRNLLTLRLAWENRRAAPEAAVRSRW